MFTADRRARGINRGTARSARILARPSRQCQSATGAKPRFFGLNVRISGYVKLDARNVPQPASRAGVRNLDPVSGVHISVSEDRPAGFRRDPDLVRPRVSMHRTQVAEVLPDRVP